LARNLGSAKNQFEKGLDEGKGRQPPQPLKWPTGRLRRCPIPSDDDSVA
jgi:hypothetical protein